MIFLLKDQKKRIQAARWRRFFLSINQQHTMKLIVFLKNKKEVVIHDGKSFLKQWHTGNTKISLSKRNKNVIQRHEIIDFIQARYYQMFKQVCVESKRAY